MHKLRAKFSEIMDKHQSMFSHSPGEWRFLNIEPLELRFTNNDTPVVAKAVPMNDLNMMESIQTNFVFNNI